MKQKKSLSLITGMLLFTTCLFLATSCNNNNNMPQWIVIDIHVTGDDWSPTRNFQEAYHYYVRELPELTEEIFRRGGTSVYFMHNRNHKMPLPFLKTFVSGGSYFTEYLRHTIQLGEGGKPARITFILEASDAALYSTPPDATFKVILEVW